MSSHLQAAHTQTQVAAVVAAAPIALNRRAVAVMSCRGGVGLVPPMVIPLEVLDMMAIAPVKEATTLGDLQPLVCAEMR